jgi:hypothetical protein
MSKYREGGSIMTKWNRLLAMLDQVLGFENKRTSTVRKVSQDFDEKTNEHVFLLEYRIRTDGKSVPKKQPIEQKTESRELLRQINAQANS